MPASSAVDRDGLHGGGSGRRQWLRPVILRSAAERLPSDDGRPGWRPPPCEARCGRASGMDGSSHGRPRDRDRAVRRSPPAAAVAGARCRLVATSPPFASLTPAVGNYDPCNRDSARRKPNAPAHGRTPCALTPPSRTRRRWSPRPSPLRPWRRCRPSSSTRSPPSAASSIPPRPRRSMPRCTRRSPMPASRSRAT